MRQKGLKIKITFFKIASNVRATIRFKRAWETQSAEPAASLTKRYIAFEKSALAMPHTQKLRSTTSEPPRQFSYRLD